MIAKFYKLVANNLRNKIVLASKNLDCIPAKGTFIWFSGQKFIVDEVHFDLDTCEYDIYLCRV